MQNGGPNDNRKVEHPDIEPVSSLPPLQGHDDWVVCVAFSPDGECIVTSSHDRTLRIWDGVTGEALGLPLQNNNWALCIAFSPDGKRIASSSADRINIWDGATGEALSHPLRGYNSNITCITFSPDSKRIVSGSRDGTLRIWDGVTGHVLDPPLLGHRFSVICVAFSPDGKHIVSGSDDMTLRTWDIVKGETLGTPNQWDFEPSVPSCVSFSPDGERMVSGSSDKTIRLWDVVTGKALGPPLQGHKGDVTCIAFSPDGIWIVSGSNDRTLKIWDGMTGEALGWPLQGHTGRVLCVAFSPNSKRIVSGPRDMTLRVWDTATGGALSLANIFHVKMDDDPLILWHVSDGIAQCQQGRVDEAIGKFDLAIVSSSKRILSVFSIRLIKAIALFEATRDDMAVKQVDDLMRLSPVVGSAAPRIIKAYMLRELAQMAFDNGKYIPAVELLSLAEAVMGDGSSGAINIYYKWQGRTSSKQGLAVATAFFGWEFETLRYTIYQMLCEAHRCMGNLKAAFDALEHMGKILKDDEREKYLEWSAAFKQSWVKEWSTWVDSEAAVNSGRNIASEYYSRCIALDPSNYNSYSNRSFAYASNQLWKEALDDAEQLIKLDPSRALGYEQKYRALHGAGHYDEAIEALTVFVGLSSSSRYVFPIETKAKIEYMFNHALRNVPHRLIDVVSGIIWDTQELLPNFQGTESYKKLASSMITRDQLGRGGPITEVVNSYLRYAMLSHRWADGEVKFKDVAEGQSIYDMKSNSAGLKKLQDFFHITSQHGFQWAWSDTCCINSDDIESELRKALRLMCHWYMHSSLTIVYLFDVTESCSEAFKASSWFTRGWTLQELLGPRRMLFYKQDWTLFWDTTSVNHKDCYEILKMVEDVTKIDIETLCGFQPGMQDGRLKLHWASQRHTTKAEDAAYSLFGMFLVDLPLLYGYYGGQGDWALGQLLGALFRDGDLSVLDWVGQPGNLNTCFPKDISCFSKPPWTPPSLDDTEVAARISTLQQTLTPDEITTLARVRNMLQNLPKPMFEDTLYLPCIVYPVEAVTPDLRPQFELDDPDPEIWQPRRRQYNIKATGLKAFDVETTWLIVMDEGWGSGQLSQFLVARILRDDLLDEALAEADEATGIFKMIIALSRPFLAILLEEPRPCYNAYHRIATVDVIAPQAEDMWEVRTEGLIVTTLEVQANTRL